MAVTYGIDFSKASVLVIGDIMLDKYYIGEVNRISPEAPVPVVNVINESKTLGGAGNVSNNISELKAYSYIIGYAGKDINKDYITQMLEEKNIDYFLLELDIPTIAKIRIIGGNQQIVRVDFEKIKLLTKKEKKQIKRHILSIIDKFKCIVISDYGKGMIDQDISKFIIDESNKRNIPIVVDPKGDNWNKYKNATIITPNVKELSDVIKKKINNKDEEIEYYGSKIRKKYNLQFLLVTRSEKGMTLISEEEIYHIKSEAKDVYDVSGAGDTVVATLATALSSNIDILNAVKLANIAAGIVVTKLGTAPITFEELNNKVKNLLKGGN
jgi:D-beta-D-heptose 7-phosphate kinase/D-beta-D-heptose 1-phosphate adenosyltransferase